MKLKDIQFLSEYLNHVYHNFVAGLSTDDDASLQEAHMFDTALKILNNEEPGNEN